MPDYFASDVHLRLDRPDRGHRFARFVGGLRPEDPLTIVGDLCDFWYTSRQRRADPMSCAGLRALAAYRSRGGSLTILLGNHDGWLGPLYESVLGARPVPEPLAVESHGLRLHLVHGHLLGARSAWKGILEGHAFLTGFSRAPAPVAAALGTLLERSNADRRARDELRHLILYRAYAAALEPSPDLAVFGHVHTPVDEPGDPTRLVVLGSWHDGGSFLKVDASGATLVIT